MSQGYCNLCQAQVTAIAGECLLGHAIAPESITDRRGKHRTSPRTRNRIPKRPPTPIPSPAPQNLRPTPHEATSESVAVVPVELEPPIDRWIRLPMLEMLGLSDPEHTIQVPQVETTTRTTVTEAPTHLTARLADYNVQSETSNTGVLIERLWEATATHEPLGDDWDLGEPQDSPERSFRWSTLTGLTAIVVIVAAVAIAALRWPSAAATQRQLEFATATNNLAAAMVDADSAAEEITGATSGIAALSDASVHLSLFGGAALQAYESASAPLPSSPPLVANDQIRALAEPAEDLRRSAEKALSIERRLGQALDYRLMIDQAFRLPDDLPLSAPLAGIADVSLELSVSLAKTYDVVSQLPEDPFFEEHRQQAQTLADELQDLNIRYLNALRQGDPLQAGQALDLMTLQIEELRSTIDAPLAAMRQWSDEALAQLSNQLAGR